jgi:hypothetical protein
MELFCRSDNGVRYSRRFGRKPVVLFPFGEKGFVMKGFLVSAKAFVLSPLTYVVAGLFALAMFFGASDLFAQTAAETVAYDTGQTQIVHKPLLIGIQMDTLVTGSKPSDATAAASAAVTGATPAKPAQPAQPAAAKP